MIRYQKILLLWLVGTSWELVVVQGIRSSEYWKLGGDRYAESIHRYRVGRAWDRDRYAG